MAGIYRLSEQELQFLLMFTENQGLLGLEKMKVVETKEEAYECVETLCKKGFLRVNDDQKYELDSTLGLILKVAEQPYGYFIMEDLRCEEKEQKYAVYFHQDIIVMAEKRGDIYDLIWIPFLPLAIGEIANLHAPYMNKTTSEKKEIPREKTEGIDEYLKAGFTWQWEMWGTQSGEKNKISIFVLSDGKEQLMLKESGNRIIFSKPDKADYVNTITSWLAAVHSGAIKEILQEA